MRTLTGAARTAAGARSSAIGPYRIDGAHVVHPDGSVSALLRTGELDVEMLDPVRRAALVAAFERLCNTLETQLQLVVRIRRVDPASIADEGTPARHAPLEAAMREHWSRRLEERAAHTAAVYVATRAPRTTQLELSLARIEAGVRALGLTVARVEGSALATLIGVDAPNPLPWRVTAHHAQVGDCYVRGYVLRRLPGHAVGAGWLAPLLRVPVECDVAVHLSPAPLGDALHSLGRRLRDYSAHQMLESERGVVGDVHVDIAVESAMSLRGRLARQLGRPLHLSAVATVRARSLDELHRRGELVKLGFHAALATAEPAHFRHLAAYLTTLPLAADRLGDTKLVESTAAATCVPWVDAGCCDPGGYRLGAAARGGAPVRIAPFDSSRHTNANVALFAASGQGKSFAMGALVLEAAAHGAGAVIIDPEGEYTALAESLGGASVSLAPGTSTALNVFESRAADPEEAVAAVTDLVSVLCDGELSDVQRAHVDAAARDAQGRAAAARRVPILSDCLPLLDERAPQVALVVRRFCTGALGALFNRPTTLRLDAAVSVVSLRDLPPEHVPAATLIVAGWLWSLVRHDATPRHIVFDEVGSLCAHAPLRVLLVQLARRCRKYGASLVVATQNARDLLGSDQGAVVATNCAIVLLGGHRPSETAQMEAAFGLTAQQRRHLETAGRGEFLLLAGDRRVELRVEVPELHRRILTGRPAGPQAP